MIEAFQNFLTNRQVQTFAPYVILVVGTCCCCLNIIIYKYGVRDDETDPVTDPVAVPRVRQAYI